MTDTQLRKEIDSFLSVADSRLLASVHALLKTYTESESPRVSFPTDLNPFLTAELFNLMERPRKSTIKGKKNVDDDMADIPF